MQLDAMLILGRLFDMGIYISSLFILLFSGFSIADCDRGHAEVEGVGSSKIILSSWNCDVRAWGDISYQRPGSSMSLYSTSNPKVSQGLRVFVSPVQDGISQDKKTLRVQRLVVGDLYLEDGSKKETESNYCDVIDMTTGCVSKSFPASSCSGHWVGGKWKLFSGDDREEAGFGLATESPRRILDEVGRVVGREGKASAIADGLYMGVESYLACYPPDNKNVVDLNDIAFYLAEGGDNYNSLKIYRALEKIAPSRVVLKINIADVLWGVGEKESARAYYREYAAAMIRSGMKDGIPSRVDMRIHDDE
ncbi:type IV pilus biogenesis/stability protein PilW [Pseudomonas sp. 30_B]|uniref:tetratricopeptide repeat protein n=1 Tax=Pseudomonas sp. 30_B TaxID=2813575 RepID=UPI001A9E57EF|nr:hypothetical protein [Pseudomonas sp. 30_B]